MKRKSILVMIIMLMMFTFQYADKDVCHAAGKLTDYGTVSKNGEVLYIPEKVIAIGGINDHWNDDYDSLKKIVVSKKNKSYKAVDGVLFNKKGTELVSYPMKKAGTTYKIPSTVKSVASYAFAGNKKLKKIVVGKNVKKFDANAISRNRLIGGGCTQLEKITVSKENKYLKMVNGVLFNKKKTKLLIYPPKKKGSTYELPNSTKYIGWYAFMGNVSLKNVTVDENVSKINECAFRGTKIEKIELSGGRADADTSLTIAMDAFSDCNHLEDITGGYRVSEVGWYAFDSCVNLKNMDIGMGLKKIDNAFKGCRSLRKICLSNKIEDINGEAFSNGACKEFSVEDGSESYKSIDGCLYKIVDSEKDNLKLMYAANTTDFKYATPENVTEVDMCAFRGRDNIKEIDIGGEIEELSWYSLINCSNLETLKLSSKLKSFDRDMTAYSFDNDLTNLKNIIVDEGNTEYESYNNELFEKGKKNLILLPYGSDSIVIPKETEYICGGIAKNKFKNIKVEDGNKYFTVNSNVLYNKDITEIIIFPSYKTTYTLPATLKEFPSMTYRYTEDYLDIEGEAWITRADENLECVKVAKGNEVYKAVDGVLYLKNTKQLEYYPPAKKGSYKIIEGTKYVNNAAFIYTKYLTSLTVPDSVKSIIISPKDSESLKEITVPVKCEVIKMTKREGSGVKVYRSLVLKC